jgi:hypothetical protein
LQSDVEALQELLDVGCAGLLDFFARDDLDW